jgi:outer membrane protein assembly factor BamB
MDDPKADVSRSQIFKASADIWGGPLVLGTGTVVVSSLDGNLYAINGTTGQEVWRFAAGAPLASPPVVSGERLLVGGFGNALYAVEASSGSEAWRFETADWVWARPLVDGNRAYFGDFSGRVYAVDANQGTQVWAAGLDKGAIRAAPALARGTLVVATEDGWLVGLDPTTQTARWERKLSTSLTADLVVQGDKVLIAPSGCVTPEGSEDKVYYTSVDPVTGELSEAEGGVC